MRAICLNPGSPYTCPPARSSFATVNSTDWGLGPYPPSNALRRMPRCDDQHSADQSTHWVGQVSEALYAGNKKGILSLICGVDKVFLTNQITMMLTVFAFSRQFKAKFLPFPTPFETKFLPFHTPFESKYLFFHTPFETKFLPFHIPFETKFLPFHTQKNCTWEIEKLSPHNNNNKKKNITFLSLICRLRSR